MKKSKIFPLLLAAALLSGCTPSQKITVDGQPWQEDWISIGRNIGIEAQEQLRFLENKEALAADGLYYATWVDGDSIPYENSDGDTVDLYDAQLYFLASESPNEDSARENCAAWLSAAKENYDVHSEEKINCSGQEYIMITYDCISDTTPYDRGISAFGTIRNSAVCVELTCLEDYNEELEPILTGFLDGCHYRAE